MEFPESSQLGSSRDWRLLMRKTGVPVSLHIIDLFLGIK